MSDELTKIELITVKPKTVIAMLDGDKRLFRRLTKYGWLVPMKGTKGRGVSYRRDSVVMAIDRMDIEELPQLED